MILRTLGGYACREDVEELCADVFVALWLHADALDPEQGLRLWLAAVARNKATDWLRCRRPGVPVPDRTLRLAAPVYRRGELWVDGTRLFRAVWDVELRQAAEDGSVLFTSWIVNP